MTIDSGPRRAPRPEGAPGDLGVVQAFVNTENVSKGTDRLRSPDELADWLAGVQLLGPDEKLVASDLELALELRRSFRRFFAAHNGAAAPRRAGEALDRVAREAHLGIRFTAVGMPYVVAPESGFAGALGRLLVAVVRAYDNGLWRRLKICADPECGSAFYDHSKNLAARWCSPRCCNRVNTRAQRRRR